MYIEPVVQMHVDDVTAGLDDVSLSGASQGFSSCCPGLMRPDVP